MDTTQFGGTFWITIGGMTLGFLASVGVYCLKAKCNQISLCWGLIKIKRDVNAEIRENAHELDHGINPYQFQPPNFTPNNNTPINNSNPSTITNQTTTNPMNQFAPSINNV